MCSRPRCRTTRSTTDRGISILCMDPLCFPVECRLTLQHSSPSQSNPLQPSCPPGGCNCDMPGQASLSLFLQLVPRLFLSRVGVDGLVVEPTVLLHDLADVDILNRFA